MNDAAIAIARNPTKFKESLTDGGSERSSKMIASFCPIETTACKAALLRTQLITVDAPLLEKTFARRRHLKFAVAIDTSHQISALLERFSQTDRHGPGEVVVTSARIADRIAFSKGFLFARAGNDSERFDGVGDFRRCDLVVTMTPILGDFHEATLKQLRQVHAGRLRGNICRPRQLTCSQRTSVQQGGEHGCSSGVGNESGSRCERKLSVHDYRLPRTPSIMFQLTLKCAPALASGPRGPSCRITRRRVGHPPADLW